MKKFLKGVALITAGVAAGIAIANRKKIREKVDMMVEKGKLTAKEAQDMMREFADDVQKQKSAAEVKAYSKAEKAAKKAGIVTSRQAAKLQKRIEELERKLGEKKKAAKTK